MQTSVTCHPSEHSVLFRPAGRENGYTLLELLIVLLLFSLLAGLVLPRLTSLYDGVVWANDRSEVLRGISELGFVANRQGKGFGLTSLPSPGSAPAPLVLPTGWRLLAEKPVLYLDNGVCLGGKIRLYCRERVLEITLRPPVCRPEVL